MIYEVIPDGTTAPRFCRYAFDAMRVRFAPSSVPADAPTPDPDGWFVYPVEGSYRGPNSRVPAADGLTTPTTPAGATGVSVQALDPPHASSLFSSMGKLADAIEWQWQRRIVRAGRRFPDGHWSWFGGDDWDNCIDTDYCRSVGERERVAKELAAADRTDCAASQGL